MIEAQFEVFKRLSGDINVTTLLNSFGASPAIFTVPVPHTFVVAGLPSVLIDYPFSATDDDTYTEEYTFFDINVRLYAKPDPALGGTARLNAAARAVRRSLKDWGPVAVEGGQVISATVTGPVDAPTTDPTNAGRLVSVRLYAKES